jgi:GAF domain-containing protein
MALRGTNFCPRRISVPLEVGTTKQHGNTHLHGIIALLTHPSVPRIVVWFALACLSLLAIALAPSLQSTWRNPTANFFLEILIGIIAAGLVYCLWVQYSVSGKRRILLAALAFSGLALERLIHGCMSLYPVHDEAFQQPVWLFCLGWQIVAGLLFVESARTVSLDLKSEARKIAARDISLPLLFSLFAVATALRLFEYWPHEYAAHSLPTWLNYYAGKFASPNLTAHCVMLVTFLAAFAASARNYVREGEPFDQGMTLCLLLLASSQAAVIIHWDSYGNAFWLEQVYALAGLTVLLIRLGGDLGKSYADTRTQVEHLSAVNYISSRASDTLDLRVVLLTLVTDTAKILSARFASIMLADECGETLTTVATIGLRDTPMKTSQPHPISGPRPIGFCAGHTARAFREQQVCVAEDVFTDVEFVPWRLLAECDGYSVSVPLICHDTAIGVLNLFFEKHERLDEERMKLFQALAACAAAAIFNAQLYERTLRCEEMIVEETCLPTPDKLAA